ncbi:hypothetical protein BDF19DRAFT_257656 [Syncephalis fuscata]|nr:hypothetical protein BDF19DRAFT_257656 [Syncephalis fuscata]
MHSICSSSCYSSRSKGLLSFKQLLHSFSSISIMSTHNNNTPPKIWQIVEIIHHILSLSEATAIIALARTCKVLYNSINRNSLWLQLYQRDFPRNINTDIDWLEWQLEQKQQVAGTVTGTDNEVATNVLGFNYTTSV